MPDQPTVACILLTKDRPQMARRAIASFRAQTYASKRLLIVNSGMYPILTEEENGVGGIEEPCFVGIDGLSIGALRNHACKYASHHYAESWTKPEIFAHWDDDDISHPNRITEQVALLTASGADVVGYRECLFWRTRTIGPVDVDPMERTMPVQEVSEAWLYSNPDPRYCIGSSLMYWRAAWERNSFNENLAPTGRGEDHEFWRSLKSVGYTSFGAPIELKPDVVPPEHDGYDPRMICSIHAGNAQHYPSDVLEKSKSWKRVPEWDNRAKKAMEL